MVPTKEPQWMPMGRSRLVSSFNASRAFWLMRSMENFSRGRYSSSQTFRSVREVPISAGMDTTPGFTMTISPPESRITWLPSAWVSRTFSSKRGNRSQAAPTQEFQLKSKPSFFIIERSPEPLSPLRQ